MSSNDNMATLYQEVILDHNRNPKNFRKMDKASHSLEGHNPMCGDHYHLYLEIDKDKIINDVSFEGQGCAISKASASMMTTILKGKDTSQAQKLFEQFQKLLTKKLDPSRQPHILGKLEIFSGIWKYPARVKCAGLVWHTLNAILEGKTDTVKTE